MKRQLWNGHALQLNPQIKEQFRVCTTVEIPEQKMTSIGFGALAVLFTCSLIHRHTTDDGWQKTVKITLGQPVGTNLQLLWLKFSLCDIRRPAKEELGSLWKTHTEALRRRQKLQQGSSSRGRGEHSARHRVRSWRCQTHSTLPSVLSPRPVPMPRQSNVIRNAPTLPSDTWKTNNTSD